MIIGLKTITLKMVQYNGTRQTILMSDKHKIERGGTYRYNQKTDKLERIRVYHPGHTKRQIDYMEWEDSQPKLKDT